MYLLRSWGSAATAIFRVVRSLRFSFRYFKGALLQKRRYKSIAYGASPWKYPQANVTQRYPYEKIPLPDHARYQLHNEIDDCVVCDKCAKICPVDCIDIVSIPSPTEIGKTSNGKPLRLYAEKFDINMSKCLFCGLCTVVCPTQCLTMTPAYDFSARDIEEHTFSFAKLTPEEALEKRKAWEDRKKNKES